MAVAATNLLGSVCTFAATVPSSPTLLEATSRLPLPFLSTIWRLPVVSRLAVALIVVELLIWRASRGW